MFEKGVSGNPAGRPKKGLSFKELYEEEMKKITFELPDPETKQLVRIDAKRMLVRQRIGRALKGSKQDHDVIENRVEGTPAETLNIEGGGELTIKFVPMTAEELKSMDGMTVVEATEPESPGAGSTGT